MLELELLMRLSLALAFVQVALCSVTLYQVLGHIAMRKRLGGDWLPLQIAEHVLIPFTCGLGCGAFGVLLIVPCR